MKDDVDEDTEKVSKKKSNDMMNDNPFLNISAGSTKDYGFSGESYNMRKQKVK